MAVVYKRDEKKYIGKKREEVKRDKHCHLKQSQFAHIVPDYFKTVFLTFNGPFQIENSLWSAVRIFWQPRGTEDLFILLTHVERLCN